MLLPSDTSNINPSTSLIGRKGIQSRSTRSLSPSSIPGWERALRQARLLLNHPNRLHRFLKRLPWTVLPKLYQSKDLHSLWDDIFTMYRLLESYRYKCYTNVPYHSIAMILAAFLHATGGISEDNPTSLYEPSLARDIFTYVSKQLRQELDLYEHWVASAWQ